MIRAFLPESSRQHCYLSDEQAREQATAIALCDAVAAQYSVRALASSVVTFIAAVGSALATAFS